MRVFVEAVERGSLSAAAESLSMFLGSPARFKTGCRTHTPSGQFPVGCKFAFPKVGRSDVEASFRAMNYAKHADDGAISQQSLKGTLARASPQAWSK